MKFNPGVKIFLENHPPVFFKYFLRSKTPKIKVFLFNWGKLMISSALPTYRGVCGLFFKIYTPAGAILQFFLAILR